MIKINKIIQLEKNVKDKQYALTTARKYLVDGSFIPSETEGFILLESPDIIDLIIVSPIDKDSTIKVPKVRNCTDKEWNEYFYKYLANN